MSRMFSNDSSANSVHITLDNAFFIIGPTMRIQSRDESFLVESEEELLQSYDENNGFNIFTNNLKLRRKQKKVDEFDANKIGH